ncbi:MAG: dihydrodipicolinate synthase family protein [Candidatus Bathyarchaeia archaeon]
MKVSELKDYLSKGVVMVVQITPFAIDESLDLAALKDNTIFLIEQTKHDQLALIPLGSTGEFYAVNFEEYKKIVDTVVDASNGKVPVIVGSAQAGTKLTIEYAKYAQDAGADGVQIVLPYYSIPSEEGLFLHYKKICEAIDIGVVIYNNPDASKIYMKPHILRRLIEECDNIVAIKENTPFIPTLYKHVIVSGNKVPVYQGRGEWWYAATALLGVKGFVSSYANFMPKICLDLLEAGRQCNISKLKEYMELLRPLDEFIGYIGEKYGPSTTIMPYPYSQDNLYISVVKASMNILGLGGGFSRLPLINLMQEDIEKLKDILFNKLKLKKYE